MSRKRKSVPTRLDDAKQQRLAWNMRDVTAEGLKVIPDADPSLEQEAADAQSGGTSSVSKADLACEEKRAEECQRLVALINQSEFCVPVKRRVLFKETEWHCVLGTFHVEVPSPNAGTHLKLPKALPEMDFWLYASSTPDKQLIYFESEDSDGDTTWMTGVDEKRVMYFVASVDVPWQFLEALQWKGFPLQLGAYTAAVGRFEITVLGTEMILMQLQFSSEAVRSKRVNVATQRVMAELHGIQHQG